MSTQHDRQEPAMPELLREIVAYCRAAGHDWSSLNEAEHMLAALQSAQLAAAVSDEELLTAYNSIDPCNESPTDRLIRRLRAILALRPQAVPMPEPVQRLRRYAGQTMRTARNPNITARDAIAIGDYLAAIGITQRADGGEVA